MSARPYLLSALGAVLACVLGGAAARAADQPDDGIITFCVLLSPDEESSPTYSEAHGSGRFTLRRSTLEMSWDLSFEKLSGAAVQANIHGPQRPGANAAALFPLAQGPSLASPVKGSIVLNDGQLKYLLSSRMYANITTQKYPAGELRGQLQRIRPGATCRH